MSSFGIIGKENTQSSATGNQGIFTPKDVYELTIDKKYGFTNAAYQLLSVTELSGSSTSITGFGGYGQYLIFGFRVFGVPGDQIGPGKHARKEDFRWTPLKMAIFRQKSRHIGSRRSRLQNSLKELILPGNLRCANVLPLIFVFLGSLDPK